MYCDVKDHYACSTEETFLENLQVMCPLLFIAVNNEHYIYYCSFLNMRRHTT